MGETDEPSDEIKDFFIVHCLEDNEVAQKIRESLEANGISVHQDFKPGKTIIDNIIYAVQHSKMVSIILTDTLRRSDWLKLDVNVAVEKAMAENKMCLHLVCVNITEELKELLTDGTTLSKLPALYLDLTKENWQKELIDHIDAEKPMRELLPGGNAAIGTLFNYFAGYLQHVLPDLAGQVKISDCYTKAPLRTFTKLILIIFESCNVKPIEGKYGDFTIVKTKETVTITKMHGGKPREYNFFFYSLTKEGCKPYFFLADCPFILSTLSKMKADGFVDIDLQLQVASFRKHLVHILDCKGIAKGTPNEFSNTAIVLELLDEQSIGSNLWRKLKDDMRQELSGNAQNPNMKKGQLKGNGFVLVVNSDNDRNLAMDVQSVLERNEVIFSGREVQDHFQQMESADWIFFILSHQGLNYKRLIQWYDAAMSSSINKDEIKIIPIVSKDTEVATLPDKFKFTMCLKEDDDGKYLEEIIKTIHGNKQKMTEKIPVFNVHKGLAYAYLFNYLPFTLCGKTVNGRDFHERLLDAKQKYGVANYSCVPRMFVIITRSCTFPTDIENEKHLGPLEPVVVSGRSYFLHLYSISLSTGQKVCYIREYATPTIAMHDMATKYELAGLTKKKMYKQSEQFASFCQTIAENQGFMRKYGDITDRCDFLYVDDQSTTIAEKLEEVLLQYNEVIYRK